MVQSNVHLPSHWRSPERVKALLESIHTKATRCWTIMEVCGGQTHAFVKSGLDQQLAGSIDLIHGPGCPVCVTDIGLVDQAIELSLTPGVTVCTFGDMMRVPGSGKVGVRTLMEARAQGASVVPVHAPHRAVQLAEQQPNQQVVFFAVGFETTAPATALSVLSARFKSIANYYLLVSHVRVPPALEVLMQQPDQCIEGFLAAGHVCTIMGVKEYHQVSRRFQVPIVITGFEPVDLLLGVLAIVRQLEAGQATVDNQYQRYVLDAGNEQAQSVIEKVFEIADRPWRGLGLMPSGGLMLREEYSDFDALKQFKTLSVLAEESTQVDDGLCQASQVLTGKIKPTDCPHFGVRCTPSTALGPPMVSDEGACAAYFYRGGK